MIKRITWAVLDWLLKRLGIWLERRELERTRDAQKANDARDRGDAGDVAERLRQRASAERERDAGGVMSPPDERSGTDKSS